jgi:hypothetical protein
MVVMYRAVGPAHVQLEIPGTRSFVQMNVARIAESLRAIDTYSSNGAVFKVNVAGNSFNLR